MHFFPQGGKDLPILRLLNSTMLFAVIENWPNESSSECVFKMYFLTVEFVDIDKKQAKDPGT